MMVQVHFGPSWIQSICRSSSPNFGLSSRVARSSFGAGFDKLFNKRWSSEAVTRQDVVMGGCAWKLFCTLPVMLLRKPRAGKS